MTLKEFLSAQKTITSAKLDWKDKKMSKTNSPFPLSKSRGLRLGTGWTWTVITLTANGLSFRLLVSFHTGKENYQAALGYVAGTDDTYVIGCLEYHGTHAGWHVHGCCEPPQKQNVGRMRYPDLKRLPNGKKKHRRIDFGVSQSNGLGPAVKFFKLQEALNNWTPI